MLIFSSTFYNVWLGKGTVNITFLLSLLMFIYVYSTMIGRVHGMVLNGIGVLRIQLISSLISPLMFLALCYVMIHVLNWGIYSVVISGTLTNFGGAILAPLQYRKIFLLNRKGIWIR